ncbi:MAG: DNA-directed RNA polymerase subunit alpha [Deltaproteobacteria bacterium]|jgi:DNA-directed RNA polymerase subunit alpha|nr:DNA-directed RNA polymerase subunit alpha [Deltaproteobacteria bacterium]
MEKKLSELKIPPKVEIDEYVPARNYAKFVCRPLERGFGLTLGNALRRVILSSMTGAAITSVKISGVLHELSTINNVKEDVADIILNLKEIRLKLAPSADTAELRLDVPGPAEVTAADIVTDHRVEILNRSQRLASVAAEGRLTMVMKVEAGRGYVPAEKPAVDESQEIGAIPVDAMFSPIQKVNFNVTNTTFGHRTDYDKLTLEVWTDGSVSPQEAVSKAAKILTEQLQIFSSFSAPGTGLGAVAVPSGGLLDAAFYRTVDELELSVRAANCLKNADIYYIGELVQKSESEMLKTKNFGRKSLNEIKDVLNNLGLHLGMTVGEFKRPAMSDE